jgi:hypothetical protein
MNRKCSIYTIHVFFFSGRKFVTNNFFYFGANVIKEFEAWHYYWSLITEYEEFKIISKFVYFEVRDTNKYGVH